MDRKNAKGKKSKSQSKCIKMTKPSPKFGFKIIIVGDMGVGKTTASFHFAGKLRIGDDGKPLSTKYEATIGFSFITRNVFINGDLVQVMIWDTAGQERFRSMTRSYYRGIGGCIICFRIDDRKSFESVDFYFNEAQQNSGTNSVPIVFGTFADQENKRTVSRDEAEEYCKSKGTKYYEISSWNNEGRTKIIEAFKELLLSIYEDDILMSQQEMRVTMKKDKIPNTMNLTSKKKVSNLNSTLGTIGKIQGINEHIDNSNHPRSQELVVTDSIQQDQEYKDKRNECCVLL